MSGHETHTAELGNVAELYAPPPARCTCWSAGDFTTSEYAAPVHTAPLASTCGWCGTLPESAQVARQTTREGIGHMVLVLSAMGAAR